MFTKVDVGIARGRLRSLSPWDFVWPTWVIRCCYFESVLLLFANVSCRPGARYDYHTCLLVGASSVESEQNLYTIDRNRGWASRRRDQP